jgi:hypothetical protein
LLAWGLTFPVLFLTQLVPRGKRWLAFWLLACAVCVAIYFWKFRTPIDVPAFAPHKSLLEYLRYLSAFLGSGLGRSGNENPLAVSTVVGLGLLLAYLAALGQCVLQWRGREYCSRVLPWVALGTYSVGSGCLAALGRIELGVPQALESRYVAFSLHLTVAIIALAAIFITDCSKKKHGSRARLAIFATAVFLCGIYLTLELLCATASVSSFRVRSAAARLGHGAVLFSQVLDTSETIQSVNFPRADFARQNADALDRLHLLRTPLVRTKEISRLRHTDAQDSLPSGWLDGLNVSERGNVTAWGWAALPYRGHPADCVVLAYADERGEWIIFALSNAVSSRSDVAEKLRQPEYLWSGWRVVFSQGALPKGAKISAWAVDAKNAKLYRLKGNETVSL